jgi:predicted PurR-regulated permease PerM
LLAKIAFYGLVAAAVYFALGAIESVLFPVLSALLISYLLDPTVDWFEDRGWSRTMAIFIILAVGFGGLGLLLAFLYPAVSHQIGNVVEGAPKLVDSLEKDLVPWLEANAGIEIPKSASDAVTEYGASIRGQLPNITQTLTSGITSMLSQMGSVAASVINLVMIPVFTFYFLRDFDRMKAAAKEYLPAANRDFLLDRAARVDDIVGMWFRAQCEVALILAGLYGVGLGVVFGVSGTGLAAGIAIGVLAGLLNVIPYFGFLIGFVLSMAMVLLEWNGVMPIVGVLAVFGIVQTLEGYVITPRVVGEEVGLSPVVVILALLIGGEVLGLVGVLLALPIAGGLRVLAPDFIAYYRAGPVFTGRVEEDAPRGFVEIALAAERAREDAAAAVEASAVEPPPAEVEPPTEVAEPATSEGDSKPPETQA